MSDRVGPRSCHAMSAEDRSISGRLLACDDPLYPPDCFLRVAGLERGWRTIRPAPQQGLEYRDQVVSRTRRGERRG